MPTCALCSQAFSHAFSHTVPDNASVKSTNGASNPNNTPTGAAIERLLMMCEHCCNAPQAQLADHPGLIVQDTKHYGRVLVAKKFFKMGEVVLLEKPTLTSEVKLTEQEESLLVYNDPWDKTRLRYVKAFCMANQKVKDEVLELFSPPPEQIPHAYDTLKDTRDRIFHAAKQCDWSSSVSDAILARVILAIQLNAHTFPVCDEDLFATFRLGSKATHSCVPNVLLMSFRVAGRGAFVALRDILPQELITYDYLGMFEYGPTPTRRQCLLERYFFWCSCPQCTGQDIMGSLPCPLCVPRTQTELEDEEISGNGVHILTHDVVDTMRGFKGVLTRAYADEADPLSDQSSASSDEKAADSSPSSPSSSSSSSSPWQCNTCHHRFSSSQTGLSQESADNIYTTISAYDWSVQQLARAGEFASEERAFSLWHASMLSVGQFHWATKRMEYILADSVYTKPAEPLTSTKVDHLLDVMKELDAWLQKAGFADGNTHNSLRPLYEKVAMCMRAHGRVKEWREYMRKAVEANEMMYGEESEPVLELHRGIEEYEKELREKEEEKA